MTVATAAVTASDIAQCARDHCSGTTFMCDRKTSMRRRSHAGKTV